MMMTGDVMDSDAHLHHKLQEPQASLEIVSTLNQSRADMVAHASALTPGFSSNGLHSKVKCGKTGGIRQLGFAQEQADWVSGCRGCEGSGEILARMSQERVSESVKMGSFAVNGSQDLLGKQMDVNALLEVKKKSLLDETHVEKLADCETSGGDTVISSKIASIDTDRKRSCLEMHNSGAKMVYDKGVKCSLKIQVIDETALLETVSVPRAGNGRGKEMGFANSAKEAERKRFGSAKQGLDERKAKQSRGKAKGARKVYDTNGRHKNLILMATAQRAWLKKGGGAKRKYSREEMEALRFVQVVEQRKVWKKIYIGLGPYVAREYDDLANVRHQKQGLSFVPRQSYGKNPSPGILGVAA